MARLEKKMAHAAKYAVFREMFSHVLGGVLNARDSVIFAVREGYPNGNDA